MKRVIAFGLIAASLIVAPTAAFAGDRQEQNNSQYTEQNNAATDGSISNVNSRSENVQKQEINRRSPRYRRRGRKYYGGYRRGRRVDQSQNSAQDTIQNNAADFESESNANSTTTNRQRQRAR